MFLRKLRWLSDSLSNHLVTCASVSKVVQVRNHSCESDIDLHEKDFDLHKNETILQNSFLYEGFRT